MRTAGGGRLLERLAGAGSGAAAGPRPPRRWHTVRTGLDPWASARAAAPDLPRLREPGPSLVREVLQHGVLFPAARAIARPSVVGADELMHVPQPAVLAPNHASDIDTPLILAALPRPWRARTVGGAASDRFYRNRTYAFLTALWINTFPFDRGAELGGLAEAAEHLRAGRNVVLYPQATRSAGQVDGFRTGVARLCIATGTPLVPVRVSGTALIMPKGRGLLQRGRARVSFGRPLLAAPDEEPGQLMERTKAAIAALARP
jgi:1-acyl-sn-glycerol-3-phosphate acyltransferase